MVEQPVDRLTDRLADVAITEERKDKLKLHKGSCIIYFILRVLAFQIQVTCSKGDGRDQTE